MRLLMVSRYHEVPDRELVLLDRLALQQVVLDHTVYTLVVAQRCIGGPPWFLKEGRSRKLAVGDHSIELQRGLAELLDELFLLLFNQLRIVHQLPLHLVIRQFLVARVPLLGLGQRESSLRALGEHLAIEHFGIVNVHTIQPVNRREGLHPETGVDLFLWLALPEGEGPLVEVRGHAIVDPVLHDRVREALHGAPVLESEGQRSQLRLQFLHLELGTTGLFMFHVWVLDLRKSFRHIVPIVLGDLRGNACVALARIHS